MKPFVNPPGTNAAPLMYCADCDSHYWADLGHHCQAKPFMAWVPILHSLLLLTIAALVILAILTLARHS